MDVVKPQGGYTGTTLHYPNHGARMTSATEREDTVSVGDAGGRSQTCDPRALAHKNEVPCKRLSTSTLRFQSAVLSGHDHKLQLLSTDRITNITKNKA